MKNNFSWYLNFHGSEPTVIPSNPAITTQFSVQQYASFDAS